MFTSHTRDENAFDEAPLRRWAREHYVHIADRSLSWPGYVLDEMRRIDEELLRCPESPVSNAGQEFRVDGTQPTCGAPKLLLRVVTIRPSP